MRHLSRFAEDPQSLMLSVLIINRPIIGPYQKSYVTLPVIDIQKSPGFVC